MVINPLFQNKRLNNPTKKLLVTLLLILLYRIGNMIPLTGIDQDALRKAFLQAENKNVIMQVINMYSGRGGLNAILTSFSLGIIPFINASILIDLLTALIPRLEKLQQEEGESGKRTLNFYKKVITIVFAIIQTSIVIGYLKPYMYNTGLFSVFITGSSLISGAMLIVWISTQIDNKGIGNGTSLIILMNIVANVSGKNILETIKTNSIFEILFLFLISGLILISQTARTEVPLVSARQLSFLENFEKGNILQKVVNEGLIKSNNLSIRFNQAGIFPIIIASNILPFLSYLLGENFPKIVINIFYYLLIVIFNYFYTTVFWDPEKISEQLRKSSVAIEDVTPGTPTAEFLNEKVKATSIAGGIGLCIVLIIYDIFKQITQSTLLNQLNISSLMIVIGVTYELQKTIRALYKNILFLKEQ